MDSLMCNIHSFIIHQIRVSNSSVPARVTLTASSPWNYYKAIENEPDEGQPKSVIAIETIHNNEQRYRSS